MRVNRGISLLELVASMCIIAALATAITPVISDLVQRSRDAHSLQNISTLDDQLRVFGDSVNVTEALLTEDMTTLFVSDGVTQGAIPTDIQSIVEATPYQLLQPELDALERSGVVELAYRRGVDYDSQLADFRQWDRIISLRDDGNPLTAEVRFLRLNTSQPSVNQFLAASFPGLDVTVEQSVILLGVGAESDLVKKVNLELPTDLNASELEYNRYFAVVWVGTPGVPADEQPSEAKVLGVIDGQLRTKGELAKAICP
jgi:energy-converting hydrogenase Eha subunit E